MWSVNSCSMDGQEMITMYGGGIHYLLRRNNRFFIVKLDILQHTVRSTKKKMSSIPIINLFKTCIFS